MYLGKIFFNDLFKVGGAAIVAQGIGIITVPIFARLFDPEVLGQYTLLISTIGIFGFFSTFRYEYALMLPKEDNDAVNILIGTVGISLLWSSLLFVLIYLFKSDIEQIGQLNSISPFIYLIPILVLLASLINLLRFWANRKKLFGFNARVSIFNSFTIRLGNIGLGSLGFVSSAALVFISLLFQFLETVYRIYNFIKSDIHSFRYQCTLEKIRKQFIRYKRFPLIDVWNGFMDTGSLLIVPILLSVYFSATEVGLYSQSLNIVQLPLVLIATTFGQVFFQRLSEAKYSGELTQVVSESFVFLFIISIPVFTVLFFWGTELFSFFLGERWARAGQYASLLAPWCLLKMVYSPLSVTFIVTERQDVFLILTITTLITRVLSIVIGGIFHSSYLSIFLLGISGVITLILGLILICRLSGVKITHLLDALRNNPFYTVLKRMDKR